MSDDVPVGGVSQPVLAEAVVYLDGDANPVPVSAETPLPVIPSSLQIPVHDTMVVTLDSDTPIAYTFKLAGNVVATLNLSWGGTGGAILTGYALTLGD